jgi:MFS family permease
MLRDHAFLGFVAINVGITFLALAIPLALPVFVVDILHLPKWAPGVALALNATLVAVSAPIVMSAISGRRRRNVLIASQACMIVALGVFLLVHLLPAGAAVALVLIAILPVAVCEVMQAAVVPAVVTESAPPGAIGRYTSAYQMTFSIGDIIVPATVAVALHAGAAALWLPLAAVALVDRADPARGTGPAGVRGPGGAPARGRRDLKAPVRWPAQPGKTGSPWRVTRIVDR